MVQGELEAEGRWTKVLPLGQHLRRWWLFGAGALLVGFVVGALALKPLIRARVRHAAAQRGVQLAVDDVSLGWGSVTLSGVGVSLRDVDALHGDLDRIEVRLSWALSPSAIEVAGGELSVNGPYEKLRKQLERWRAGLGAGKREQVATGARMSLGVRGLAVTWQVAGAKVARLDGISYQRPPEGPEEVGVESLTASAEGMALSVTDAKLTLDRQQGRRVLKALHAGEVAANVALSKLPANGSSTLDKPKPAVRPGGAHPAKLAPAQTRGAKLAALLPALDPQRGTELRRSVDSLAQFAQAKLPPDSKINLDQLNVTLTHEHEKLHLGPNRFRMDRFPDRVELQLLPGSPDQASPLSLKMSVPFGERPVRVNVSGGPVSLASLGVKEGDFSLREVARSQLALGGELTVSPKGDALSLDVDGRLSPLSFRNQSLSSELLRGSALGWHAKGRVVLDGSRYEIERLTLSVGDVEASLSGTIEKQPGRLRASLRGGIPLASCQALLDSAPEGLLPLLRGMKFAGTFALDSALELDTSQLDKMRVRWDFKNECRVTEVSVALSPRRFFSPFRLQVKDATGRIVSIETGPGTLGWTPYAAISPNMETAVLICEDGRFFRHQGFDREAIENSIKENVKAGRFVRGASTISMQLAKNLYLSFDKTLARKLQEAVLTTLLEQELSKQEMMELYLNVIEYGPGIYGIGAAAKHYFNTTPEQLSLGQSLYLASILPNPAQQHFTPDGSLSDNWHKYLQRLMRIAVKIGRIGEADYELALNEEIRFGVPDVTPSSGVFFPPEPDAGNFGEPADERAPPEGM